MPTTSARHIAIIMDGNGRWANSRKRPRTYGHLRGASVAKKIITHAAKRGVPYLTLFTFSSENWLRPTDEVNFLMRLLARQILREQKTLMANNIRFVTLGRLNKLPDTVRKVVVDTVEMTKNNSGMCLVFALSYGGRQEIVDAARALAEDVKSGRIEARDIDEAVLHSHLESNFLPEPDLVIRTSGENRLSNFMLWHLAYSELLIVDKMWPEFTAADFDHAIEQFYRRRRRFGKIVSSDLFAESST